MRYALLLLAAVTLAQSQPPSPAPGKAAEKKQDEATPKNNKAAADNNPPNPSIFNGVTVITGGEQKQATKESESKPSTDWWAIINTGLVTIFTGALAVLARLQWQTLKEHKAAFETLAKHMGDGLEQTTKAADAARDSAIAAKESNELTQDATSLTRQAFILTHRPKLIVRNVAMDYQEDLSKTQQGQGNAIPATGTLRIANIGYSAATVISVASNVFLFEALPGSLPMKSPLVFDPLAHTLPEPIVLPPGKYGTMSFPRMPREEITTEELFDIWQGLTAVYVIGEIIYRDDLGNVRTTLFCRKWQTGYSRFATVDNPDYESAD